MTISDSGPGMSEEFIRTDLFRPLRSTKGKGFGIGAYQARSIMREQGGDMLVSSVLGRGTTVTLKMKASSEISIEAGGVS